MSNGTGMQLLRQLGSKLVPRPVVRFLGLFNARDLVGPAMAPNPAVPITRTNALVAAAEAVKNQQDGTPFNTTPPTMCNSSEMGSEWDRLALKTEQKTFVPHW